MHPRSFVALALVACSPGKPPDAFVAGGGAKPEILATTDGHVRIPLAPGLSWERVTEPKGQLAKAQAKEGPTYVVVAVVDGAPKPITAKTCAEHHRLRIAAAAAAGGVTITPPQVSFELRGGVDTLRLHYATPLEARAGARPASAMSAWTYFADGDRCVGVGVTTVVREKVGDPKSPDPEDLSRLERVFSLIADAARAGATSP